MNHIAELVAPGDIGQAGWAIVLTVAFAAAVAWYGGEVSKMSRSDIYRARKSLLEVYIRIRIYGPYTDPYI